MEWNRNQFFMAGLIVLFLGIQLRYVDSYVLTKDVTTFLAKRFAKNKLAAQTGSQYPAMFATADTPAVIAIRKTVKPPNWLGWAFLSAGAVMILQSFAMAKPG